MPPHLRRGSLLPVPSHFPVSGVLRLVVFVERLAAFFGIQPDTHWGTLVSIRALSSLT